MDNLLYIGLVFLVWSIAFRVVASTARVAADIAKDLCNSK